MPDYFVKGSSNFNTGAAAKAWMAVHLAGYSSGDYIDPNWKEISVSGAEGDPYWLLGGNGGDDEVEIGLSGSYRIKVTDAGIWGYHSGDEAWYSLWGSGVFSTGVTDHGLLDGLGDDDHTIYLLRADTTGYETVSGDYLVTSGNYVATSGDYVNTSGDYVTLSGDFSEVSGDWEAANWDEVSGDYSTMSGSFAGFSGDYVDFSGVYAADFEDMSGDYAVVSGGFSTLSGDYADVSGSFAEVSGDYASVSGSFALLSGSYAEVSGSYALMSGDFSDMSGAFTPLSGAFVALSGDYLTTSGTVSDYVVVSGVAATALQNVVEDITPQLGGMLGINGFGFLTTGHFDDDHSYEGLCMSGIITGTFGSGLYLKTNGEWDEIDADAAATMPCAGLCVGENVVMFNGLIRDDSFDLVLGSLVYGSLTLGQITGLAPSAAGDQVQRLGYCVSGNTLYFNPDYTVLELK